MNDISETGNLKWEQFSTHDEFHIFRETTAHACSNDHWCVRYTGYYCNECAKVLKAIYVCKLKLMLFKRSTTNLNQLISHHTAGAGEKNRSKDSYAMKC